MADKKNLLQPIKQWAKGGNAASTLTYVNGDNYSCSWTASSEGDYIYVKLSSIAGKNSSSSATNSTPPTGRAGSTPAPIPTMTTTPLWSIFKTHPVRKRSRSTLGQM